MGKGRAQRLLDGEEPTDTEITRLNEAKTTAGVDKLGQRPPIRTFHP